MNRSQLKESLIAELRLGTELIRQLSDDVYTKKHRGAGSVGEHFRHNLEFGNNFISGTRTGRIDYSNRLRDPRVENERAFAINQFELLIEEVRGLGGEDLDRPLAVRSEVDEEHWLGSSMGRELEFVHSHTVHHYALIAAKLNASGFEMSEEFGVAPSTLKYWRSLGSGKRAA